MSSKTMGLPPKMDHVHRYRSYEGVEYKEYWSVDKKKQNLDMLEHDFVRALLPASGQRILDLGCGFGRLADCYLDRFHQAVLLDGSMTLLRQAQEKNGEKAIYVAADANHLPFRHSSFDCVLLFRVFHHIPDSQRILSDIKRLLCYKGTFVFDYCNKASPRQLVRWILRLRRDNPLSFAPAGIDTRFISHHPQYVYSLLQQNGYSGLRRLGTGIIDKFPDPFGILLPMARWLAPISGFTNTASWINCSVKKLSGEEVEEIADIEKIFICPSCHGNLIHGPEAYICAACRSSYPIKHGIIDFRMETNETF